MTRGEFDDTVDYLFACVVEAWSEGEMRAATYFARRLWTLLAVPFTDDDWGLAS
jgi:hypothetical protein